MLIRHPRQRRDGATSVEFAIVAVLLFMLLFGIFEYARFLFVYHLATNATRDAARFAAVHTGGGTMPNEPIAVTAADVAEVWRSGLFAGRQCGTGMCGAEGQLTNYTVDVYAVPDSALYATPADLDPAGKPAWNGATFHQQIAVRVTAIYRPALPSLLGLGSDVPFTITVLVGSEGN